MIIWPSRFKVARGEPLVVDASRVRRIYVARNECRECWHLRSRKSRTRTRRPVSISAWMAASECCGRVMDLRDVVHRRDAVVELREAPEQLVDVDVLRPVHRGELQQDEFEVSRASAWRTRSIIDENAVSEEAAQRRLELVVMRIDEAGHHNAAGRIDLAGAAAELGSVRLQGSSCPQREHRLSESRRPSDPSTSRRHRE